MCAWLWVCVTCSIGKNVSSNSSVLSQVCKHLSALSPSSFVPPFLFSFQSDERWSAICPTSFQPLSVSEFRCSWSSTKYNKRLHTTLRTAYISNDLIDCVCACTIQRSSSLVFANINKSLFSEQNILQKTKREGKALCYLMSPNIIHNFGLFPLVYSSQNWQYKRLLASSYKPQNILLCVCCDMYQNKINNCNHIFRYQLIIKMMACNCNDPAELH